MGQFQDDADVLFTVIRYCRGISPRSTGRFFVRRRVEWWGGAINRVLSSHSLSGGSILPLSRHEVFHGSRIGLFARRGRHQSPGWLRGRKHSFRPTASERRGSRYIFRELFFGGCRGNRRCRNWWSVRFARGLDEEGPGPKRSTSSRQVKVRGRSGGAVAPPGFARIHFDCALRLVPRRREGPRFITRVAHDRTTSGR